MLTIKDIVDLAKAGYKPAEVKELLELSKSEDKEVPADDKEAPAEDHIEDKDKDKDIDYKALYESTKLELDKAQKENRKKDISDSEDDKTDDDILKDLFKEFM